MGDSKKSFWDSTVGGFASQGIQGAIGAGLGLLLQKGQDRRQIRQQEKLQALEIAGQKQLTDYNQKKALEMWEARRESLQVLSKLSKVTSMSASKSAILG